MVFPPPLAGLGPDGAGRADLGRLLSEHDLLLRPGLANEYELTPIVRSSNEPRSDGGRCPTADATVIDEPVAISSLGMAPTRNGHPSDAIARSNHRLATTSSATAHGELTAHRSTGMPMGNQRERHGPADLGRFGGSRGWRRPPHALSARRERHRDLGRPTVVRVARGSGARSIRAFGAARRLCRLLLLVLHGDLVDGPGERVFSTGRSRR